MRVKIKINEENYDLYCIYSKEPIYIGEKYGEVTSEYQGEPNILTYKLENLPAYIEDEEPYICEDE